MQTDLQNACALIYCEMMHTIHAIITVIKSFPRLYIQSCSITLTLTPGFPAFTHVQISYIAIGYKCLKPSYWPRPHIVNRPTLEVVGRGWWHNPPTSSCTAPSSLPAPP